MTTATSVLRALRLGTPAATSSAPDPASLQRLLAFSRGVGALAFAAGALVLLAGWAPAILALAPPTPGLTAMKVNTAIGIMALGTALLVAGRGRAQRAASLVAAGLALLIGLVTLAEYAFAWGSGFDEWLVADPDAGRTGAPGRPAIATGVMLVVLGAALLARRHPALGPVKSGGAIVAAVLAWSVLTSYVFGGQALQGVPLFSAVAPLTAAAIFLLAAGVLASEPVSRPAWLIVAPDVGGTACRWLLLPALFAPAFVGWLLHRETLVGGWPEPLRWAMYSAISSLGSVGLIMMLANRIRQVDAERSAATVASLRDPLTGLANRRAFDAFLLEHFDLSRRHRQPLSLLLVDIDLFKTYNDDFGHPAGDELLRALAALLSSAGRGTDLVARVGGEEFALVLPQTGARGALQIAERIRHEVGGCADFRRRVTVSIGVAELAPDMDNAASLVRACDAALYRAKAAGRDLVRDAAG